MMRRVKGSRVGLTKQAVQCAKSNELWDVPKNGSHPKPPTFIPLRPDFAHAFVYQVTLQKSRGPFSSTRLLSGEYPGPQKIR
jgi:hypothetical protein